MNPSTPQNSAETDVAASWPRCGANVWLTWLEDWFPGYRCWIECAKDAEGATDFWEVTWKN